MGMLGESHGPDKDAIAGVPQHFGESPHFQAGSAALAFEQLPILFFDVGLCLLEAGRVPCDKIVVDPPFRHQMLQGAVQEGQVSAGINSKPGIRDLGSENRRFGFGRDPISSKAGLEVRVYDRHLGPVLTGVVQVLHRHRLIVRGVGAEENDQVSPDPVAVRAGGGAVAKCPFHRHCGSGVAEARRVVNVIRSHRACCLLGCIVVLVHHAARSQVDGEPFSWR